MMTKKARNELKEAYEKAIAEKKFDEAAKIKNLMKSQIDWSEVFKVGINIAVPVITLGCNLIFAKKICNFEQNYTWTTSAGKALSKGIKI